ncbi:hypothetical protein KKF05_05540 [Patescibacteria group bacterium]|nr:hypothetical protein [Patescibacteria group bacterium]MBU1028663.1 hypothetical protein [Patescibacteria group bacterium]
MSNKNLIIIVVVLAAALLVVISAIVVLRRSDLFSDKTISQTKSPTGATERDSGLNSGVKDEGIQVKRGVCGDGICSPDESVKICFSDCVSYDIFSEFKFVESGAGKFVLSWTTTIPMTSIVDYGRTLDYELGSIKKDEMTTTHEIEILDVPEDKIIFLRFRGREESGSEHEFIGHYLSAPESEGE